MADLTTVAAAALWIGAPESDPHLSRLVSVASDAVAAFLNRDVTELVPLPASIEQATLDTVANLYRNRTNNPLIASMSLGDGSVSYRDLSTFQVIPAPAQVLLHPFRRFRIASSS